MININQSTAGESVSAALRQVSALGPDHWAKVSKRWLNKGKRNLKAGNHKGKWEAAHDLEACAACLEKWAGIERPQALIDIAQQAYNLVQEQITPGAKEHMLVRLAELNLAARFAKLGAC